MTLSAFIGRTRIPQTVAAILCLLAAGSARAQSNSWDGYLNNTQWYVPAANLLAYVTTGSTFANPEATADQTIWHITSATNGAFSGTSTAEFTHGILTITSTTSMSGTVNEAGQLIILFSNPGQPTTIGLGQVRGSEAEPYLEMQMITGEDGTYVSHWAYMAQYEEGTELPPLEITGATIWDQWSWIEGTDWDFQSVPLFGTGETGTFQITNFDNGYFWGSGSGPSGSPAESFTLLGSATPEGNVLFNLLADGELISLTGFITGNITNGQMTLTPYDPDTGPGAPGTASVVPEPATAALAAAALAVLALRAARIRRRLTNS